MEKYLPEDMRLEETSVRRSMMSSSQREQLERLLVDDNKVEGRMEVVEEEGRRRSTRRSTTISYQLPSESEESDLEELVVTKDSTKRANVEDRHEKGLQALEELETFDFGVKPSASQTRAHKAGLSISISRPRQAAVKRKTEEILEIVDSSEEEEDEEVVELEERKTRSGRISRKPTEVAQMPSKSQKKSAPVTKRGRFGNGGRRKKDESDSDTDDDDGDEDDDVLVEMEEKRSRRKRIRSERSDKKEPELIMRRALRSSTRTVHTVDID